MTQRELAEQAQVGVPHISKVEANRENPSDDLIARLAKILDIESEELFIAARRLPEDLMERFAAEPARALQFLRKWDTEASKRTGKQAN